jgi:RND family efflux transporter MFP subunit
LVQTAARNLAQQRLTDTVIGAPFRGKIQTRLIAPGTYVQPGQVLFSLVRTDKLRFRSSAPERYAHLLQVGQKVSVEFAFSGQVREGLVSRISPNIDPLNRSLPFEIDLDNSDGLLRSGLFGEATIELDPRAESISIPLKSLRRFAGVGTTRDDRIEIKSGVGEGDILIEDAEQGRAGKYAESP